MAQLNITLDTELLHGLFTKESKDEAFSKLLEEIFNQVLIAQSTEQLGAEPYERSDDRRAYRNGFRDRELTTRVGALTLRVPRHRNGNFSTTMFERYQRSEQALVLAMIEMVINGVSTRKIENITEELCGKSFSKSMVSDLCKKLDPVVEAFKNRPLTYEYPFLMVDAIYIKARDNHRVRSKSLLIAIGVNEEGYREIIGFHLSESESETSWDEFFISLKQRGLKSPRLITSDSHKGLVKALHKQFQGSSWQRCQTHFSRNLLDKTPKSIQPELKEDIRKVYEAVDMDSARAAKNHILNKYESKAPKAMELLDEGFDDTLEGDRGTGALSLMRAGKTVNLGYSMKDKEINSLRSGGDIFIDNHEVSYEVIVYLVGSAGKIATMASAALADKNVPGSAGVTLIIAILSGIGYMTAGAFDLAYPNGGIKFEEWEVERSSVRGGVTYYYYVTKIKNVKHVSVL